MTKPVGACWFFVSDYSTIKKPHHHSLNLLSLQIFWCTYILQPTLSALQIIYMIHLFYLFANWEVHMFVCTPRPISLIDCNFSTRHVTNRLQVFIHTSSAMKPRTHEMMRDATSRILITLGSAPLLPLFPTPCAALLTPCAALFQHINFVVVTNNECN